MLFILSIICKISLPFYVLKIPWKFLRDLVFKPYEDGEKFIFFILILYLTISCIYLLLKILCLFLTSVLWYIVREKRSGLSFHKTTQSWRNLPSWLLCSCNRKERSRFGFRHWVHRPVLLPGPSHTFRRANTFSAPSVLRAVYVQRTINFFTISCPVVVVKNRWKRSIH